MMVVRETSMNYVKKSFVGAIRMRNCYLRHRMPFFIIVNEQFIKQVFGFRQTLQKLRLQILLNSVGGNRKRGYFQCRCRFRKSALHARNWSSADANGLALTSALVEKNH